MPRSPIQKRLGHTCPKVAIIERGGFFGIEKLTQLFGGYGLPCRCHQGRRFVQLLQALRQRSRIAIAPDFEFHYHLNSAIVAAKIEPARPIVAGDGRRRSMPGPPTSVRDSPTVVDGIPAVFEAFGVEEWVYQVNHKILGEGNFVLSISEGTVKGVHSVFYDLLRFEDGKVAEHWDVIQAIPTEGLANDNGMFGFK